MAHTVQQYHPGEWNIFEIIIKVQKYEMQAHVKLQTMAKAQKWGWFLSWTQL